MDTFTPSESLTTPDSPPDTRSAPFTGALARALRSWQFLDVFAPLALSRLGLMIVGWLAMSLLNHIPTTPAWEIGPQGDIIPLEARVSPGTYALINMWSRWDAGWYREIAQSGYKFTPGQQSNSAFFPAYAMLMRAVHAPVASEKAVWWFLSGIVSQTWPWPWR